MWCKGPHECCGRLPGHASRIGHNCVHTYGPRLFTPDILRYSCMKLEAPNCPYANELTCMLTADCVSTGEAPGVHFDPRCALLASRQQSWAETESLQRSASGHLAMHMWRRRMARFCSPCARGNILPLRTFVVNMRGVKASSCASVYLHANRLLVRPTPAPTDPQARTTQTRFAC